MDTRSLILLASLLAPSWGCSGPAAPVGPHKDAPGAIRVLPLGDSITQADSQHMSYRYWLWQQLQERQLVVDFVGTQDANHNGNPDFSADFDRNHQGHWGWRTDEVLAQLPDWLQHYTVDIALVHLGTNDCLKKQAVDQTLGEFEELIALLRARNPQVAVVFSPLGPTNWHAADCLHEINQGLQALTSALHRDASPVVLATPPEPLSISAHLYDGLHPNADGEKRLATMWLQAINRVLPPPH